MRLYELPIEAQQIEFLLEQAEGELTPELEQRLKEFLEGGERKLENAACVARSLQSQSDACKAEGMRLAARRASLEANLARLKAMMLAAVDKGFKGKVKTPMFTIYGQASAKTVSFEMAPDADMLKLPDEFVEFPAPKLDTAALRQAWKSGQAIPAEVKVTENDGTRFVVIR